MSEKHVCGAPTYPRGESRYIACGRTAKFERDGKWYCGIHDPVKRKEREDRRQAKWDADVNASRLERAWNLAAMDACRGLDTETMLKLGPGWVARKLKEAGR